MIVCIKIENGYVTLTTPPLGVFAIRKLKLNIIYMRAKFVDSRAYLQPFQRSLVAAKFKMGQVTLTTPLLRVICHPYAGT